MITSLARLAAEYPHRWPAAFLLAQRLRGHERRDAAAECATWVSENMDARRTAYTALMWAAPDLADHEDDLGAVTVALAVELDAGAERADRAATVCCALASAGLALSALHEPLWRLWVSDNELAENALKRVAARGHPLPAIRDRLLAEIGSGSRLRYREVLTAAWRDVPLTGAARTWWTRQLTDYHLREPALELLGNTPDPDVLDEFVADVETALRSPRVGTATKAAGLAVTLLPWRAERIGPALVAATAHRNRTVAEQATKSLQYGIRALIRAHPDAGRAVLRAAAGTAMSLPLLRLAAQAGDAWAIEQLPPDEPPLFLALVQGDSAAVAAELERTDDAQATLAQVYKLLHWTRCRDPQPVVDAMLRFVMDPRLEVRLLATAALADAIRAGVDLSLAVPALASVLDDDRKYKDPPLVGGWWMASVSIWAAVALGGGGGRGGVAALRDALHQRRAGTRRAGAYGLGIAATRDGGIPAWDAVLDRGDPSLIVEAMVAATDGRNGFGRREAAGALVRHMWERGISPAIFVHSSAWFDVRHHCRADASDGLATLLDALASPSRDNALVGLARAAEHGDDVRRAIPLIIGALYCGDWGVRPAEVLDCLHRVLAARPDPADLAMAARWVGDFLNGDVGRGSYDPTASATRIALLAARAGVDVSALAPRLAVLAVLATEPADAADPGWDVVDRSAISADAASALVALIGQGVVETEAVVPAWR